MLPQGERFLQVPTSLREVPLKILRVSYPNQCLSVFPIRTWHIAQNPDCVVKKRLRAIVVPQRDLDVPERRSDQAPDARPVHRLGKHTIRGKVHSLTDRHGSRTWRPGIGLGEDLGEEFRLRYSVFR